MTIRHLRIFIAVAEAGTMSLAAKRLYIAQPHRQPGDRGNRSGLRRPSL